LSPFDPRKYDLLGQPPLSRDWSTCSRSKGTSCAPFVNRKTCLPIAPRTCSSRPQKSNRLGYTTRLSGETFRIEHVFPAAQPGVFVCITGRTRCATTCGATGSRQVSGRGGNGEHAPGQRRPATRATCWIKLRRTCAGACAIWRKTISATFDYASLAWISSCCFTQFTPTEGIASSSGGGRCSWLNLQVKNNCL
jgi:hypothetical protein